MNSGSLHRLFLTAGTAITLAAATTAHSSGPVAGSPPLDSLIRNPPFGTPVAGPLTFSPVGAETLEFRGIILLDGHLEFSIHDHSRKRACWLRLMESSDGLLVRNYDEANQRIEVVRDGLTVILPLKRTAIENLAGRDRAEAVENASSASAAQGEAASLRRIRDVLRRDRELRLKSVGATIAP